MTQLPRRMKVSQESSKSTQRADKDASSSEGYDDDDANVMNKSDKSASAGEACDTVTRTKADSDTGAKASEVFYTDKPCMKQRTRTNGQQRPGLWVSPLNCASIMTSCH